MSIINKMHQGLQVNADNSPMLASMPAKKQKKKVLLFTLISLLLASSIGLSYLIYDKENAKKRNSDSLEVIADVLPVVTHKAPVTSIKVVEKEASVSTVITKLDKSTVEGVKPSVNVKPTPSIKQKGEVKSSVIAKKEITITPEKKVTVANEAAVEEAPRALKVSTALKEPAKTVPEKKENEVIAKKTAHLEIKKSILSPAELANIHLKRADKAELKGDIQLAIQEKRKALNVKPDLHNVRESLALYYYGIGEQQQATSFLKKGALQFPEYSDFNLMLSRIALKNGEQQKAYLYLQQSPPKVEGHLDYYVSYAILAQKFKDYERSERLYEGLLTQRPNNGRWRMSLAIAQDKTGKEKLAVENYKKALLQIDLSSNAKKYINQRLTYLANQ